MYSNFTFCMYLGHIESRIYVYMHIAETEVANVEKGKNMWLKKWWKISK